MSCSICGFDPCDCIYVNSLAYDFSLTGDVIESIYLKEGKVWTMDLNDYARKCHKANERWWYDLETGEKLERNKGELLCLIHSEISEAMEGERKGLKDDKLPHRSMAEVELVDALIRIFDYAGAFGYDLEGAFREKMNYNASRHDHTKEGRLAEGGKKW